MVLMCIATVCFFVGCDMFGSGKPSMPNYQNPQETYNTYSGITIDGKVNEDEWANVNAFESVEILNPYGNGYEESDAVHYVEFATKYSDEGLLMYFKVFGAEPLINVAAHPFYNSGIELYLAPKDASVVNGVAWQIGLLYDGTYILTKNKQSSLDGGFAYITHNGYIDIKGEKTVIEDNLEETGYVIETMFPWELLGFGDKPEWINVDVALQYKTDITSVGRDMWYSIGQNNKENYSLGAPTSWFKFNEDGYCDGDIPIPYVVNNGEEVVNGKVFVIGNINKGAKVEVTPNDGYVIKSLKVNGEVINTSVYEIPANSTVKLDVEVEFILESEIVFSSINANVKLDKIGTISSVADGETVKLISFTFEYDVEVVDGKITKDNIAPGLYDVIVDGYKVGKITVGEEEYVDDIVLEYNVFSSVSNPNAIDISKANDGEISMVGGGTAYFAEDDLVFVSFDLVDSCTLSGQRSGLGIFMGKDGVSGYTNAVCLFYDNGYAKIRQMYVNWNVVTLGTYVPGDDVHVSLAIAVVDGNSHLLYKYNSDAWKIAWSLEGDYGYIKALNSGSSKSVVSNLNVSDTIPEITFDAVIKDDLGNVITDGSLGTVSIENNGFGKQSVITIDAVNGYRINSVIINGENVTTALMGGVLNYTSVNVTNDVVVIFEEYGEYNATLTFNYAESNIFGASKIVDAGSVITIEGLGSYTIGNDGVLVLEKLYSGTYKYTVSGCDGSYSFTVGKENLVETAYLTRKVIASASNPAAVDLSNINNGTFTTTNACNLVINETNAVFVSADTVDISTQGGNRSGFGIYLSKDRASWVSAMCVYIENGAVKLRHMYSNWTTLDLGTAYNTGDEVSISLAAAIYGGKVYYLYKYNTTEWQVAWIVTGDYGYIAMIGSGITSTVSNLVIREEVPTDIISALEVSSNVTIKDGEGNVITDGSIGSAVVNSGIVGENATVTVSTKEGYIIDTVLVNGQNVTAQLVDGVYTFVANTTNIDVEVKFAIGQFKATLTLTYADDYVYGEGGGFVEAGAVVTVVGKVGTYFVGENGTVVIDNLPAGSYEFTLDACSNNGTFEIVSEDVTVSATLLRKVIDSSSAPANADYSNANAGTITWTAGANLFLYNQNVKFVSAKYTGVAQSGNKNSSGFYIYMDRDQSGNWTQAYMLRYDDEVKPTLIQNKPWEGLRLTSYYTAGTTYSVYLALALYEGYGYMLFKTDVNADWRIFKSFENVYGDILMIGAGLPTTASELKISETVPADVANFLTTSSTLTIKDGEGNVVTDGSIGTAVVESSVIGAPATITVTPVAGYSINSLSVNGTNVTASLVDGTYTFNPTTNVINVEVVFSTGSYNATITVKYADDVIYGVGGVVEAGTVVTIDGKDGSYVVGENGLVVIEGLPAGSYSFNIPTSYHKGTFTIVDEDITTEVSLYKKVLTAGTVAGADVSDINNGNITWTAGANLYLESNNVMFVSADSVSIGANTKSGFYIYMQNNGAHTHAFVIGFVDGALKLRHLISGGGEVILEQQYVSGTEVEVSIALAYVNGVAYSLYKYNGSDWKVAFVTAGNFASIKLLGAGVPTTVSQLLIKESVPQEFIDMLSTSYSVTVKDGEGEVVSDETMGTVAVDSSIIGQPATVTVSANEGYIIGSVKVNGQNVSESLVDGVYTFIPNTTNIDVEVVFTTGSYSATLTLTYADDYVYGEGGGFVEAGAVVTVVGKVGTYVVGENGTVVIENLPAGSYEFTVDKCSNSGTFEIVDADVVSSASLLRKVFSSETGETVNYADANNGNVVWTNSGNAFFASSDIKFASVKYTGATTLTNGTGFAFYMDRDQNGSWTEAYMLRYDTAGNLIFVKNVGWETLVPVKADYVVGSNYEIDMAMAIYDGYVYMLYKVSGAEEWQIFKSVQNTFGDILMLNAGKPATVTNLRISETVPEDIVNFLTTSSTLTIKDGEGNVVTDGSMGTVEVNSTVIGKPASVAVSAKEGNIIGSVKVNGQNVTAQLVDGVYTFTATTSVIDVEVVFTTGSYSATITLTYADDYVYGEGGGYVEAGAIVTVVGKVGTYVVGENGTVVIDNLPAGSYEFTVDACSNNGTFEIVGEDVTVSATLLRKVIDSSSAPANADYSNANAGTITWTAGANLFLYNQNVKFVSAKYTGVAQSGNKNSSGFYIYMDRDQSGNWTQAYMLRYDDEVKPTLIQNKPWEGLRLTSYYTAGTTYSVYLALALYEGYGYMLFKTDVNADWRIFKSFENVYGDILMIGAGLPTTASELKISETVPADVANFLTTSSTLTIKDGEGNVVTDGSIGTAVVESSVIGAPATVTVTPVEGYSINTLIVNGVNVTASLVNGVYTFVPTTSEIDVEVVFAAGHYKANLTLKYSDDAVHGAGGYIEEGAIVTVIGQTYTVGQEGLVVIDELPVGSYTFTVDTCANSYTFEIVDSDISIECALLRKIFVRSSAPANVDYSDANNGNVTWTNGSNLYLANQDFVFVSARYNGGASSIATNSTSSGFYIYMSNDGGATNTEGFVLQYINPSSNANSSTGHEARLVRHTNWGVKSTLSSSYSLNWILDVHMAVALYNGNVYFFFKWNNGDWRYVTHFENTYGNIHMIGCGKPADVSELTLSYEVPSDVMAIIETK